ncbi:OmpA family protein [bacterium]|nr:OmpA family protein [bacterium]
MKSVVKVFVLSLFLSNGLYAQLRPNLNNWFIGGGFGTTVGHTDVRPKYGSDYIKHPTQFLGYIFYPEVSYNFTHSFGVVVNYSIVNIRGNERDKDMGWRARSYNTNLNELKIMGHLNLGRALSFNLRKNTISPYVNLGVGSSTGHFHAPLSQLSVDHVKDYLKNDNLDTTGFQTWNKNLQVGFYIYGGRYFDFDIRYNYTFFNEDYVDGSWPLIIGNREWDKYSALSVGMRFKFGVNNRRTYEHTSWAREPMEEDTSLFNTYVDIEEYDDGNGNPVFKVRTRPTNINEEELTKINTDNSSDDDMYQAVYNTLMQNPDLRDSIMAALARDLKNNDAFITRVQDGVCVQCPEVQKVVVREDGTLMVVNDENNTNTTVKEREGGGTGTGNEDGTGGVNNNRPGSGVGGNNKNNNPVTKIDEFELRDIYYDLDEAYIRTDASNSLDELAKLLKKYPNLKIELGSHTDCRNSKNYNLALSQRRALAAVNYLVCQGIDRCRLVAKAYGESQLVNNCDCEGADKGKDCTDEQHQQNRRTTVKILDYNYQPGSGNCQEGVAVDEAAQKDADANSVDVNTTNLSDIKVTKDEITAAGINMSPAAGYYIVIGTSYKPNYANSLALLAKDKESFDNAGVLYLEDTRYFVFADMSTNYEEAMKKLKAVRCCTRFPDAWIYGYNVKMPGN